MMVATAALLEALGDGVRVVGALPAAIAGLADDSRRVQPGALYVALRGQRVDGHNFARAAAASGAVAVVVERELAVNVAQIVVADTRIAISRLAAAFFGYPARDLRVAGVTGTNGKTTTVHLIAAILNAAGSSCATIGTLGAALGGRHWPLANTTPPALELHELLATLRSSGAQAVALEVSSHALTLGRVEDVRFDVAVVTNVTRDHLDFHGTFAAYADAKRHILELAQHAAINVDDPTGRQFAHAFPHAITYAIDAPAAVRATEIVLDATSSRFRIDGTPVMLPLRGRFNVSNALGAWCAARLLGIPDATIARGLAGAGPVPGRMERIAAAGIDAIVDYAHSPDALENLLVAARETTRGRLVVVFGCGGDRDSGKRPQMGALAARLADRAIVTSDNPRSEDPLRIALEVAGNTGAEIILDRRAAIRTAIGSASAGDTVIVAGKGHEANQVVGDAILPFDDRDEVRAAFAARPAAPAVG